MKRSLLPGLLLLNACSWSRFSDVSEETPIVLLNKPGVLDAGFGVSLATATLDSKVQLLVGGAPLVSGAAVYELGTTDRPSVEASDTGHCRDGAGLCFLSSSPAALTLGQAPGMPHDLCFVNGAGEAADGPGAVVRCDDDLEYHLELPPAAADRLTFALTEEQGEDFLYAADRNREPLLLASLPILPLAWFYGVGQRTPLELSRPAAKPESYGTKLGVARVGQDGRLLAVAAPTTGQVFLYKSEDGQSANYLGCLGDTAGFGRGIGSGAVLAGDADEELIVADNSIVYVFDGRALFEMTPALDDSCSLASLPDGALIASFSCGSSKNIADCGASRFGEALSVGDIDGDGDGEVVVGAPGMTVRETKRAGAVLVYDVESPRDEAYTEVKFISSAEQDDGLGAALATPFLGDRSVIVAGAPGNGKVALFYCSSLLPADKQTNRCK